MTHDNLNKEGLAALRATMAARGLAQRDLAKLLGSRSRASEILHGKRGLSRAQCRVLHERWGIPLAALLGPAVPPPPCIEAEAVARLVSESMARFMLKRRVCA